MRQDRNRAEPNRQNQQTRSNLSAVDGPNPKGPEAGWPTEQGPAIKHTDLMTEQVRRRPGRPTGGQPVVDREHVLDAAERAIRREGPGVSIEAIAHEAGVTKPIVYARVGKRTNLADALAHRLADRLLEAAILAMAMHRTGRTQLVALIRSNLETLAEHRDLFLFVSSGSSEEMPQRTLYLAEQSAKPLAQQLAAWRKAQGLDASVAVPWSYGIVGLLHLASLWWITESDEPADRLAEELAELLWSGFGGASVAGDSAATNPRATKPRATKAGATKAGMTRGKVTVTMTT